MLTFEIIYILTIPFYVVSIYKLIKSFFAEDVHGIKIVEFMKLNNT